MEGGGEGVPTISSTSTQSIIERSPSTAKKEDISLAYIQTIAAKAGFACIRTDIRTDGQGIDVEIRPYAPLPLENGVVRRKPKICIQAKATNVYSFSQSGSLSFPLGINEYLELIDNSKGILVLFLLPESESDWIIHSEEELITRKCAYWLSLYEPNREGADISNGNSRNVHLASNKIFGPEIIIQMMDNVAKGRDLTNGLS